MNRAETLSLLSKHKPELQRRFGVSRLALFGSRARAQARDDSDIDVLVAFDGPASSARYFGVRFYLEDLFGCPVLVTETALRYSGIDSHTVWSIVHDDVAPLRAGLKKLLASAP